MAEDVKYDITFQWLTAIKSISEEDLARQTQNAAQMVVDRKARLQSYVTLVNSASVAEKVLAELGPKLNQDAKKELTAAALLRKVKASLVKNTDTISIKVT